MVRIAHAVAWDECGTLKASPLRTLGGPDRSRCGAGEASADFCKLQTSKRRTCKDTRAGDLGDPYREAQHFAGPVMHPLAKRSIKGPTQRSCPQILPRDPVKRSHAYILHKAFQKYLALVLQTLAAPGKISLQVPPDLEQRSCA